ncbi:hypothetical protein PG997_000965 [Apiospora hydei]|uniref:Heterokaryon incompatibility domain-containing protein n=1 Tax=Apiospora hydei TaxID=1337664 RepID=A0ABR1XC54_9PEZI
MNKIYRTAEVVLMWLGEEEEDSEVAFNSIPTLSHASQQAGYSSESSTRSSSSTDPILEAVDAILEKERVAYGWAKLARRTYFRRAWIFQEIILAGSRGRVMCGSLSSPWDLFKAALRGYHAWTHDWVLSINTIFDNDDDFRENGRLKFLLAIVAMSEFRCSNPRDRVFATLGLVEQDYITADYTNTVQAVIVKANILCIQAHQGLGLWMLSDFTITTRLQGLPSWAVDITQSLKASPEPWKVNIDFGDLMRSAMRTRQMTASFTTLYVDGCIIDKIIFATAITKEKETFDIVKPAIQAMSMLHRGLYDLYPYASNITDGTIGRYRKETNGEALLAALLEPYDESPQEEVDFEAFLAWKLSKDNSIPDNNVSKHPPSSLHSRIATWNTRSQESKTFDLAVCKDMERRHRFYRSLVYTEKGCFGLSGDAEVCEGMVIALVDGVEDLTLLKKRTQGRDEWYERCGRVFIYGWDEQSIRTLDDIKGDVKMVRLEIR